MARIRTIKPEFPQSETVGRLSRDARLLFVQIWTIADDSGRLRGNLAYLSGALYPYDEDARGLIAGWTAELVREGCIRHYTVDGKQYIDIPKWLEHQKIDRPTASRLPSFDEGSRAFDEGSTTDLGPTTVDHGPRTVGPVADAPPPAAPAARATRLSIELLPPSWRTFCAAEREDLDPDAVFAQFRDFWIAKPARDGTKLDWFATWRNWCRNQRRPQGADHARPPSDLANRRALAEAFLDMGGDGSPRK